MVVATAAAVLAACAGGPLPPPRDIQAGDLASLAGTWEWSAWAETPARLGAGPMRVRLDGGKLRFETARASGTLTLHQDGARRVLAGQGVEKAQGQAFAIQLTQRRASGAAASAPDGAQFVLLIVE
jgi:hypothetical protein